MSTREVVVVSGARTGIGDYGGSLKDFAPTKLGAILAHRTQICEWERIPEPLRWIYLDEEAFVQARPNEDAAPRSDLLEGIDAQERTHS